MKLKFCIVFLALVFCLANDQKDTSLRFLEQKEKPQQLKVMQDKIADAQFLVRNTQGYIDQINQIQFDVITPEQNSTLNIIVDELDSLNKCITTINEKIQSVKDSLRPDPSINVDLGVKVGKMILEANLKTETRELMRSRLFMLEFKASHNGESDVIQILITEGINTGTVVDSKAIIFQQNEENKISRRYKRNPDLLYLCKRWLNFFRKQP